MNCPTPGCPKPTPYGSPGHTMCWTPTASQRKRISAQKRVSISLVENMVMNYPSPLMEGWRFYRIEYGGHGSDCFTEMHIWLPPNVNADTVETLLLEGQYA